MAKKLKNLQITSTDLVDAGANPDAHIRMLKSTESAEEKAEKETTAKAKSFVEGLKEATEKGLPNWVQPLLTLSKEDSTEDVNEEELENMKHLLKSKKALSDMTEADKKAYEDLAKRYELPDAEATIETAIPLDTLEKGLDVDTKEDVKSEEVAKAEVLKMEAMSTEIEALKKSLAMKELEELASGYEVLGKKKEDLAQNFYKMKSHGEEVFTEYKKSLDDQLNLVEKSGMYAEVGSSTQGSANMNQMETFVAEVMKRDGISHADAVVKAYEENPELAKEYEANY